VLRIRKVPLQGFSNVPNESVGVVFFAISGLPFPEEKARSQFTVFLIAKWIIYLIPSGNIP
jgi:hypothetical protein